MTKFTLPEGHPISLEKASELLSGELADVYRKILGASCVPMYWYRNNGGKLEILHNGTMTLVRTPKRLLGITAAHVLLAYRRDLGKERVRLQLMEAVVEDMMDRVIDVSEKLDLATIAFDEKLMAALGNKTVPLDSWPPLPPQEGRGIMLAGFPGIERQAEGHSVEFGCFTILGVARTVTDTQITWLAEPEYQLDDTKIKAPNPEYNLGGISGGPLIGWFESPNYVSHYRLSGIITEHPNYEENTFSIERLIAIRADLIRDTGTIL